MLLIGTGWPPSQNKLNGRLTLNKGLKKGIQLADNRPKESWKVI